MANYKIFIKPTAVKELKRLPKKDVQRITDTIQSLAIEPRLPVCEKLPVQEKYRIRQGNYRIIYAVEDDQLIVNIVKIGHQRDVYK